MLIAKIHTSWISASGIRGVAGLLLELGNRRRIKLPGILDRGLCVRGVTNSNDGKDDDVNKRGR